MTLLAEPAWASGDPLTGQAYLTAQLARAERLAASDPAGALDAADRALSFLAALKNPGDDPAAVARGLARANAALLNLGQVERAFGLHKATGAFVEATLPQVGSEAGARWLTTAALLDAAGELPAAYDATGRAETILKAVGDAAALTEAQRLRASLCVVIGRDDCAEGALQLRGPPPGVEGRAVRLEMGRRIAGMDRGGALAGAWRRPGALERWVVRQALGEAAGLEPATAFTLFQVAARTGPSFDADALTALGRARSEAERRAVHQALRLRARRDRLERAQLQALVAQATAPPAAPGRLQHDTGRRLIFRDFARRIAAAEGALAKSGVALSGANLTPLAQLQAALAADEAAIVTAPVEGGLALMCVRRGATLVASASVDAARLRLDARLLQQALTATHAPSEALDNQFPAEAAVRTFDALIRPVEPCLKAGDRIVWLPSVATAGVPLAALLRTVPPRAGRGYDLAAAEWLVARHAVSYAGGASVITALRGRRGATGGDLDFLGLGDPILGGQGAAATRGVRGEDLAALAPLPDTKDELIASAQGFRNPRILVQAEATERRFRRELVGSYRFLSFATHGLIREDLQGLSEPALVLTPVSMADPRDDGLLTASEIADLNLRALFVALSACNTANFDLSQMAQDLPALSSAFQVAGVPSTLGTLWPVNSETGRLVVAAAFARLRETPARGSSQALAEAQRAFLANPPSPAYRHPRFWAPFVILGDGGALAAAAAPEPTLGDVEVLTARGGEVLDVRRRADGVAARLIGDADANGRYAAATRLAGPAGEAWRQSTHEVGATRFTAEIGGRLLVTGYRRGGDGRFAPTLEALDPATGAPTRRWSGEGLMAGDAFPFAGAVLDPARALVVMGELRNPAGPKLALVETDAALATRVLAATAAPAGAALSDATLSRSGDDLILTYTDRTAPPQRSPEQILDDYDLPDCLSDRITWVERRDGRTGELEASRQIRGLAVVAALPTVNGEVLLAGSQAVCGGEARAAVVALDRSLETRPLYADETLGASEVRTLAALPSGRVFVAASKEAVFDFRVPPPRQATLDPYRLGDLPKAFSGLVLTLDRNGRPSGSRTLDAGGVVLVTTADATRPDDILLGGGVGGEAAIFHLKLRGP